VTSLISVSFQHVYHTRLVTQNFEELGKGLQANGKPADAAVRDIRDSLIREVLGIIAPRTQND